jgi:hypothetical protein
MSSRKQYEQPAQTSPGPRKKCPKEQTTLANMWDKQDAISHGPEVTEMGTLPITHDDGVMMTEQSLPDKEQWPKT